MATELGKAYVQIVASAGGLKTGTEKLLNKEAGSAGKSSGSSFNEGFSSTLGGLASTIKKVIVAAGIGKIITDSINIGAALEQSLGGVEAIFGDAADIVKKNAEQAFASAGVSANEYMEGVTSFAASLLQSTGGNAVEAANVADMAFRDMSDNANRFGTDMGSIQAAYQGFAKQNYTMLDNLKLGYGGTKTEMERLLKDAQELSNVEYNIDNLDDVYEAIHVIQEQLNVTGTTAAEAASTFSGSLAMMKAAGKNLLGSLTLGQDIQPALGALLKSVEAFGANALRLLGNIISGIPELMITALQQLPSKLRSIVPEVIEGLFGKKELSEAIGKKAFETEGMVKDALGFVTSGGLIQGLLDFVQELLGTMDSFIDAGFQLVNGIIDGLMGALPELVASAGQIIAKLLDIIITNGPQLLSTTVTMLTSIVPGLISAATSAVGEITGSLAAAIPTMLADLIPRVIEFAKGILDTLPEFINTGFECIQGLITGILSALPDLIGGAITLTIEFISAILDKLPEFLSTGANVLLSIVTGILNTIPELINSALTLATEFISTVLDKLPEFLNTGIEVLLSLVTGILDTLPTLIESALTLATEFINTILDKLPEFIDTGIEVLLSLVEGIVDTLPELVDSAITLATEFIDTILDQLPEFIDTGIEVLLGLVEGIVGRIPEIATSAIKAVIAFIGAVGEKLPQIIQTGITLIAKLVVGLIQAIPKVIAAIPKIIQAAVREFKNYDWAGTGKAIIEGIVSGIKNLGHLIADTLTGLAKSAWQGVKNFLGIGSPSKVFAEQIGQWIPAGIAMGIEDNAGVITDAMDDISGLATGALTSEMVLAANAQAAQINAGNMNTTSSLEASLLTIIELIKEGKVLSINGQTMAAALAYDMDNALGEVAVRKGRG